VANWHAVEGQLTRTSERAKEAFDKALDSGDIERIATTSAAYHDAVMANLQAELEMVKRIEAAFQAALDAASALVGTAVQVAQLDITSGGGFGTITALLGALQGMAETASTAAQRIWAVQQGLQAIIAVLPTAITTFATLDKDWWLSHGMQSAGQLQAGVPAGITRAVSSAALPFLAAQQADIDKATGAAKLGLLQQQAANVTALANAAIAGVNQWAQSAIAGAREAADAVIKGLTEQKTAALDKLATDKTAALDAIDKQITSIQKAADAEQEFRTAQMAGLSDAIAKAEEFAAAVKQMGEFIQGLKVGPVGPGNPMDKLILAQDAFAKALTSYNAHPTAAGLTGLQDLAQTVLSLAEPIFSKPSPQFQTLSATTIKQLQAAQDLAAGQASDSEVLKQQLAVLQALDKAAVQGVKDQLAALADQKTLIADKFDREIKTVGDGFDKEIAAVEAAFKTQKEAIEKAAQDEIDGINTALTVALKNNMTAQAPLLKAQFDAANALLDAVGPTAKFQADAIDRLTAIRDALNRAIPPAGTTPTKDAIAGVPNSVSHGVRTEGIVGGGLPGNSGLGGPGGATPWSPDPVTGPRTVVPPTTIETGHPWDPYAGTGITAPATPGVNLPGTFESIWEQQAAGPFAWGGPNAAKLNALEGSIRGLQDQYMSMVSTNAHYNSRHQIVYSHSAAELATLKTEMEAKVATIRAQITALIGTPTVTTPPGTTPRTPPYVPPGPGWLSGTQGTQTQGGVTLVIEKGAIVITGVADPEQAAAMAVKQVEDSVKSGRIGVLVDQRVKAVR